MDSIPYVGTKDALEVVMDKIQKRHLSIPEAIQVVIGSLQMLEPSSENIEKVWVSNLMNDWRHLTYNKKYKNVCVL